MNFNLTWLEKFTRLNEIDPNIAIKLSSKNTWYLSTQIRLQRAENGLIDIIASKNHGKTPEQAVNDFWSVAVDNMTVGDMLVIGLNKNGVRWQNSKWVNVI
jgi:hypothetical protein